MGILLADVATLWEDCDLLRVPYSGRRHWFWCQKHIFFQQSEIFLKVHWKWNIFNLFASFAVKLCYFNRLLHKQGTKLFAIKNHTVKSFSFLRRYVDREYIMSKSPCIRILLYIMHSNLPAFVNIISEFSYEKLRISSSTWGNNEKLFGIQENFEGALCEIFWIS